MLAAASRMRIESGCDSGVLLAILNEYSAAPARVTRSTAGAKTRAAAVPCKRIRRLVDILPPRGMVARPNDASGRDGSPGHYGSFQKPEKPSPVWRVMRPVAVACREG